MHECSSLRADALLLGAFINAPVNTRPRSLARLADRIIIASSSFFLCRFFPLRSYPDLPRRVRENAAPSVMAEGVEKFCSSIFVRYLKDGTLMLIVYKLFL
jgi:hypothetical protein